MLYSIVENFSPADGERWSSYCAWRGIQFERFDSIDGILRPSLCNQPEAEDWDYIVNQDFMLHFFLNLNYARIKREKIGKGVIVAISFEDHVESNPNFLGYDLIDRYNDISLLTNWGNDINIINEAISKTGLIRSRTIIEGIQREIFRLYKDDPHVEDCKILSIYKTE